MKNIHHLLFLVLITCVWILIFVGCENVNISQSDSNLVQVPAVTKTALTITKEITPTPVVKYKITYISNCNDEYDCIFAVDLYDLENEHSSFGVPQRLFTFQKDGDSPAPPVLYQHWSADGQQVLIDAVGLEGKLDVFIAKRIGGKWINLTNSPLQERDGSWSPDGNSIYFLGKTGAQNYNMSLFSVSPDGNEKQEVIQNSNELYLLVADYSISPDGKKIVIESTVNLYEQLFIADIDGSNLQQLTYGEEDHFEPHYSPDGQWILYRLDPKKLVRNSYAYLLRPDGSEEVEIPIDLYGFKADFSWSPDGNWIAFDIEIDDIYRIYIVHPDGTGLMQVTDSDVPAVAPNWRMNTP